jgi:alpha-tubulin suppressor-like RCC1 family protein
MRIKTFFVTVCVVSLLGVTGSSIVKAEPSSSLLSIRSVASAISVGNTHACALNTLGNAFCWGNNSDGQLGNGTFATSYTAVPVVNGKDFIAISVGFNSTCALSVYKTIWCWGENYYGGLGNGLSGRETDSAIPVQVAGITTATAVTVGSFSACALLEDRTVKCWGSNSDGQLGNGTSTSSAIPTLVSSISNVTSLSLRTSHACAVLSEGTVKCWGYGYSGQLGNNTTTSKSVLPVSVSNLNSVVGVTTPYDNTCALQNGGSVSCWGQNDDYQNGHDRNRGLNLVPELNNNVANVQTIASGSSHVCVLINDGSVKCWGSNFFGQLGNSVKSISTPNGTTGSFYIPEVVAGLSGVVALNAGSYATCALLSGGSVKCWGANSNGILGNGEITDSYQPVSVMGIGGLVGASTASTTTTTTTLPKVTTSIPPNTYYVAPPSVAKIVAKPTLSTRKTLSAKSLATYSGLKVVTGSTVSMTVSSTSRTTCRVSGAILKAIKKGTCRVAVTVKSRTGKKSTRNLTLNVRS